MGRRTRLQATTTATTPAPVETKRLADPDAWARALEIAGGNVARLVVESYNSVLVQRASS